MSKKAKKIKFPSELRLDSISGDWVVIATGRARRPEIFKKQKKQKEKVSKKTCPFCNIFNKKSSFVVVVPNKYPAFIPNSTLSKRTVGAYEVMNAVGFHEVVITRDHIKSLGQFSTKEIKEVINAYQQRYLDLMNKKFVNYISIFHNHGIEAGASISHPHSQIIAIPLIDDDLKRAILNSKKYFKKERKCFYCQMNKWERKEKRRIIFENKDFLVLCPFASKSAFQLIVSPKKHLSYFERITEKQKEKLAEAFKVALGKLYKGLNDPPYNFYLHSAPCDGKNHNYYHWHWTILPKTSTWAGFEIGTKIEISTIEPEKAAEYLKKQ